MGTASASALEPFIGRGMKGVPMCFIRNAVNALLCASSVVFNASLAYFTKGILNNKTCFRSYL